MRYLPKSKTWIMFLVTLGFLALLVTELPREISLSGARRTDPIRQNLAELRRVLMTLERPFEAVHEVNECEQAVLMQSALETLKDFLLPHLAAEEDVLYPAVDRELPASWARVTDAMRQEHEIMRRWIGDLERLADGPLADHNAFARRGERLLGLIEAHFEVDESILFPILDQAVPLTRAKE